jgi:hypothetical protein
MLGITSLLPLLESPPPVPEQRNRTEESAVT